MVCDVQRGTNGDRDPEARGKGKRNFRGMCHKKFPAFFFFFFLLSFWRVEGRGMGDAQKIIIYTITGGASKQTTGENEAGARAGDRRRVAPEQVITLPLPAT